MKRRNVVHRILSNAVLLLSLALAAGAARAEEPESAAFQLDEFYALGIGQHRLDAGTEVVGWRISPSWYVGQREQKGAEDGLSLIWQGDQQQVSFSLDGIRIVRRF